MSSRVAVPPDRSCFVLNPFLLIAAMCLRSVSFALMAEQLLSMTPVCSSQNDQDYLNNLNSEQYLESF